jgi:hypothetical protein
MKKEIEVMITKEMVPTQKLGRMMGKEKELADCEEGRGIWKRRGFQLKLKRTLVKKEGKHSSN